MSKAFEEKYLSFLDWLISQAAKQLKLLGINKFTTLIPADETLGTGKAKVEIEFNYEDVEIDISQLSQMRIFQFYRLLNGDELVEVGDEMLCVEGDYIHNIVWRKLTTVPHGSKACAYSAVRRLGTVSKMHEQLGSGEIKPNKNIENTQG